MCLSNKFSLRHYTVDMQPSITLDPDRGGALHVGIKLTHNP
jgi:hypothetical protein